MINSKLKPTGYTAKTLAKKFQGVIMPTGDLKNIETRDFWGKVQNSFPQKGLPDEVNQWRLLNLVNIFRGLRRVIPARMLNLPHFYGYLGVTVTRGGVERINYGTASLRVVTTAGVNFIVDAFQNSVELENMRYHGIGTNNAAEAIGDTALGTELTTEYNPDNTRATGSLTEGASANIFRTVGTNTLDSAAAIVEYGIFSQAATGGGVLLDRTIFSVINLSASDGIEGTFDLTLPAGG